MEKKDKGSFKPIPSSPLRVWVIFFFFLQERNDWVPDFIHLINLQIKKLDNNIYIDMITLYKHYP